MKSNLIILVAILISSSVVAQTLDDIVSRHLEAVGHDNLLEKNTIISKGKIIQGQNEFPFTSYNKRPDKFRTDSRIMEFSLTQAFDGTTGWVLNPMMGVNKPTKLYPAEIENLKFQSEFDGYIYNHQEKDYSLEYTGDEEISGLNMHVLLLIKASGDSMHIFIDSENYLIKKTRSAAAVGGEVRYLENIFSNYKEVDGILSAFEVETQVEGMTISQLIYESYEYNAEIADSMFAYISESEEEPETDSSEPE